MVLGLFQDTACLVIGLTTGSRTKALERLAKCCLVVKVRLLEARRAFWLAGAPIDVFLPIFKAFTSTDPSARLVDVAWKFLSWLDMFLDNAMLLHDLRLTRGKVWHRGALRLAEKVWTMQACGHIVKLLWQLRLLAGCSGHAEEAQNDEKRGAARQLLRHIMMIIQLLSWANACNVSTSLVGFAGVATKAMDISSHIKQNNAVVAPSA